MKKKLFTSKVKTLLIVAVALAIITTVVVAIAGTTTVSENVVGTVLQPLRSGVAAIDRQALRLYDYIFSYESLQAENAALKEQIAQMEDDARVAASLSRENDRLRALLELKTANEDYKLVDGYIISWSSNDWSNTFTINRGQNVGIEVGMCAITANGEVVGLVTEVGSNFAVVKTVLDSSLEISATIVSSGYTGMVQGAYSTGKSSLLRMDYLPSAAVIRNNDQVVTSGSTVYPRNLILGYVVDAGFDDTGVAKFALLKPAADIETLEQVFILTSYNAG